MGLEGFGGRDERKERRRRDLRQESGLLKCAWCPERARARDTRRHTERGVWAQEGPGATTQCESYPEPANRSDEQIGKVG